MNPLKSKIENALYDISSLGTKNVQHIQGLTLYHHLVRVQKILASWGCDENTQVAGLYHSLYSTEYFTLKFFDIHNRKILQDKLGVQVENLVYLFAILDRKSITCNLSKTNFEFKNYITQEVTNCEYSEGVSLIHILFANDLDHIRVMDVGTQVADFKKYAQFYSILNCEAQVELSKIVSMNENPQKTDNTTFIRFIAHSGVQIADSNTSIVIDPWLYDSRRDSPIIEGLDPTQKTIDYLIPAPRNTAIELSPDIVCLSHFHTHHSPLREIVEFAKIKNITVICPPLTEIKLETLKKKIGAHIFSKISFIFVNVDREITIKGALIKVYTHWKRSVHLIYNIHLNSKSIMHIVDAQLEQRTKDLLPLHAGWERVHNTKPDFLFIGAAGHLLKKIHNGKRIITNATTLTPIQAAKLAVRIMPRYVGIIGLYNHSVWDDRLEMTMSSGEAETQFHWCLSYLAPSIHMKKLIPGDIFD